MMTPELIAMGILRLLFLVEFILELTGVWRRGHTSWLRGAGVLVMFTGLLMITLAQPLHAPWLVLGWLLVVAGLGSELLSHTKPRPPADRSGGTNG